MPVYEYRCDHCHKRASILFRSYSEVTDPICPHCGSAEMTKLVSRVARIRSEEERLDALADPSSLAGVDENDPKSVATWARKMGSEMGEDLDDDFEEVIDAMERGEDPSMEGSAAGEGDFGELD